MNKLIIMALLAVVLLAGCGGASGSDGYYNDTPTNPIGAAGMTTPDAAVPTPPPTAAPAQVYVVTTIDADTQTQVQTWAVIAIFFLSPVVFFLYVLGIGRALIRRYLS